MTESSPATESSQRLDQERPQAEPVSSGAGNSGQPPTAPDGIGATTTDEPDTFEPEEPGE